MIVEFPNVFPARAGMNRFINRRLPAQHGVPRTRGDEPSNRYGRGEIAECSPHARG